MLSISRVIHRCILSGVGMLLCVNVNPFLYGQQLESDAVSLYAAAMENNFAIRSYEVRITERYEMVPALAQDHKLIGKSSSTKITRLFLDHDAKRCFRIARFDNEYDIKVVPQRLTGANLDFSGWLFNYASDGKQVERFFLPEPGLMDYENLKDVVRPTEFDSFLSQKLIPLVEFCNFYRIDTTFNPDRTRKVQESVWAEGRASIRTLPDGTQILKFEPTNVPGFSTTITFDPISRMPFKQYCLRESGENARLIHEHTSDMELVNGIYRTTHIVQRGRKSGPPIYENSLDAIQMDASGEITIDWIQFNKPNLELPDIQKLGWNEENWARFLGVDLLEIEKGKKSRRDSRKSK